MKIYDREGAPNPARIRIVLAEKGLEDQVEFVSVDLIAAGQKQDSFLAMNPIGKIPVLELDDGLLISESTAITEYLDNLDGHPTLTGRNPREKAVIHMMQRRAEMLLLEPVDDYFHYGTPGLGKALRPWRMPDWSGAKEWGTRRGAQAVRGNALFQRPSRQATFPCGRSFFDGRHHAVRCIGLRRGFRPADRQGTNRPRRLAQQVSDLPAVKNRSGQHLLPEDLARLSA